MTLYEAPNLKASPKGTSETRNVIVVGSLLTTQCPPLSHHTCAMNALLYRHISILWQKPRKSLNDTQRVYIS